MSFNYDFGKATCELVEAIEGHDYKRSKSGLFEHYERLGVGKTKQFVYDQLSLQHNRIHYFNFMMVNVLAYTNIISSKGVLVDLTTPLTGLIKNASADYLEIVPCLSLIPEQNRPDWKIWCKGINPKVKNHRLIIDGSGSLTVFNGPDPMTDLRYTRANRYISVDLRTIGVADQAIIIDKTPPEPGTVNDGPLYGTDLLYTKNFDTLCANWLHFYDPESGIAFYMVSAGSLPDINVTDIANLTQYNRKTHEACVPLSTDQYLEHGKTYYTTVWAYNGAIRQRNCVGISNGVTVDLTKPVPGQVIDGNVTGFKDVMFSPSPAKVEVQWRNYYDPESTIKQYEVQVERAPNQTNDYSVIRDWVPYSNTTRSVKWLNFHLQHKDKVKVNLRTTNGALNTIVNTTDGFVVDLTPPTLISLGDGLEPGKDIEFQSGNTTLSANFKFVDEESGLDHYKFQIYERHQGITQQIVPHKHGAWLEVKDDIHRTKYTHTGLSLHQGGFYSIRVGAVNKAGFVAAFDTSGGLTMNPHNQTAHSPHTICCLKAINGAGLGSDPVISTPIIVVDEDEPGIVIDGADRTEIPIMSDFGDRTLTFHQSDYVHSQCTVYRGLRACLHGDMAH
ncbi:unnamed protein product [Mytilus coruscus]|uniref:Uncharacterized protein n=1 Tax=Mytilus coruscus TaxID=42192 RepID=A0A6J8BKH5_MYTCO|nr:unnamed protein product [Mytilus coruscus]